MLPAIAARPPQPTPIGILLQDPSLEGAQVDVVTLDLIVESGRPASKDYELSARLEASAQGNYVFAMSEPESLLPASILGNLQRSFDLFTAYCDQVPPHWANGQQRLTIFPDYGEGIKACYSGGGMDETEAGLYFFHKEQVYTGLSGEIVCHEGGHALLDRFRPRYRLEGSLEVEAFSESFGDVLSMLVNLKDPKVAAQVVQQTGGDLTRPNIVADFGEQFGLALHHGPCLRSAINAVHWQANPDPHALSQAWTGAVYDILGEMVRQKIQAGFEPTAALTDSTEEMLKIYGKLISHTAPQGNFRIADMAHSMVEADRLLGGQWGALIEKVMQQRQVLSP